MNVSRQEGHLLAAGRSNQKTRTRRALLEAATALIRHGASPTIAEVAEAALVSVPTAYRYFSSPQELWVEVTRHLDEPDPDVVFGGIAPHDAAGRVEALIKAIGWRQFDDEALWRNVTRVALERWFQQASLPEDERTPVRGERRMHWIAEALQPLADQMDQHTHHRLANGLALVFGTEALITLRDTCQLDRDEAQETMLWAARAILDAARRDKARRERGSRRGPTAEKL
jgi:AcrR family transcriptional regulator